MATSRLCSKRRGEREKRREGRGGPCPGIGSASALHSPRKGGKLEGLMNIVTPSKPCAERKPELLRASCLRAAVCEREKKEDPTATSTHGQIDPEAHPKPCEKGEEGEGGKRAD